MDAAGSDFESEVSRLVASLQPVQTSQAYVEDVVLESSRSPPTVGVVERTHEDVDSHAPQPETDYPGMTIHKGANISASAFATFLEDGIPPKGAVLVRWQGTVPLELVRLQDIRLIDRSLLVGDVVKRNAQSTMSGTVTGIRILSALLHTSLQPLDYHNISRVEVKKILRNVPADELKPAQLYREGAVLVYDDWVGRVDYTTCEVALRLSNGSVVVPEDLAELENGDGNEEYQVGEVLHSKKGNLRRGRWVFGAYDANIEPIGIVVESRPITVHVAWLFQRPGSSKELPPEELDTDILDSGNVHLYDPTRTCANAPTTKAPSSVASDLAVGDFVRMKDPAAAVEKYKEGLVHIPRTQTLGFDINTLCVLATRTEVVVRWQDCSTTTHWASSLVPDLNIDDDDEVWPGEIVHLRESKGEGSPDWAFTPAKVGVVQSVTSADRIARIRWWRSSNVQYYKGAESGQGWLDEPGLIPDASLEDLQETVDEVSLYDIRPAVGLNKRLGDFVLIKNDSAVSNDSDDPRDEIDWLGEVIDLGSDGLITVRQGLRKEVRDIRVRPEHLVLVYSSDMNSPFDDEDGEAREDDASDASVEAYEYDTANTWFGAPNGMDYEYHETFDYQGNDGQRIDEDGGDDAWSTESESDDNENADTPMTDLKTSPDRTPPQAINDGSPLNKQVAGSIPAQSQNAVSLGREIAGTGIQPFLVLDGDVPDSHHYCYSTPAASQNGLRRIAREHRIFRKDGALPDGVLVRTWESRLDLLRVLFIGPLDTPYMYAPFVMDIYLGETFPNSPPDVYFHSWTDGSGPVNPNLYEDGKVCLSLLGTWSGEQTESWNPEKSTILQVLVSILGLVLVKEPYFNEAGFEVRVGSEDAKIPSALYSERTYLRSRAFILHALRHPVPGLSDELRWLYLSKDEGAPGLLERAVNAAKKTITTSQGDGATKLEKDGIEVISAGAVVKLKRQVQELEKCMEDTLH